MASVLETFFIIFKTNSKDVKKGTEEAGKATDDLDAKLKKSRFSSEGLGQEFLRLSKSAVGALAAIASVGAVIASIGHAEEVADSVGKLSDSIGVSSEKLSAWGEAVKRSGGSAEGFQSTVRQITASLADFATKGHSRTAPFFKELGVRMTDVKGKAREAFDVFPEIASAFEKLSKSESFGIGQKLGLDEGTIMLLQRGRREVDSLILRQKELGVITKKDAEVAAKFHDAWADLKQTFQTSSLQLGRVLLPVLTSIVDALTKFFLAMNKNKWIMAGFLAILAAIFAFFMPWTAAIAGAVALIAGAFFLISDEIRAFKEGGDSYLGDLVKLFGKVKAYIMSIVDDVSSGVSSLLDGLGDLADGVMSIWDGLKSVIMSAVDSIRTAIDYVLAAYEKVKNVLGVGGDKKITMESANRVLSSAESSPINSLTPGVTGAYSRSVNKNTNITVSKVEVQTQASDAKGIADAFGRSMSDMIRQAINTTSDSVVA